MEWVHSVWEWVVTNAAWTYPATIVGSAFGGGWLWKLLAHKLGRDDLDLRERKEISITYAHTSARAQGRDPDRAGEAVSVSEQFAAMRLLAELANKYEWLRDAVITQLDDQLREAWYSDVPKKLWIEMSGARLKQEQALGRTQQEIDDLINEFSERHKQVGHRDRMVEALISARDAIRKAPRTPFPQQKMYYGELGPYYF